ncbi:MAG: hypothetical protein AB8B53_04905 [Flavobacteriales bacterium]
MKYLLYSLILMALWSCETEEGCFDEKLNQGESRIDCGGPCELCAAEYPELGPAGLNLLAGEDTLFASNNELSLSVTIPRGTTLNTEIRLLSGTAWQVNENDGWTVNEYIFDRQVFFAPSLGTANLKLIKGNVAYTDTIQIRYFENGSSETLRKIVVWE